MPVNSRCGALPLQRIPDHKEVNARLQFTSTQPEEAGADELGLPGCASCTTNRAPLFLGSNNVRFTNQHSRISTLSEISSGVIGSAAFHFEFEIPPARFLAPFIPLHCPDLVFHRVPKSSPRLRHKLVSVICKCSLVALIRFPTVDLG